MRDTARINGKEFFSRITDEGYEITGAFQEEWPQGFTSGQYGNPFARDECGNLFTENEKKEICFWNLEMNEVLVIALSWRAFSSGCVEPGRFVLHDNQVKTSCYRREFAKQMGFELPMDG